MQAIRFRRRFLYIYEKIDEYAENESTGNGSNSNLSELKRHTADSRNENDGNREKISVVAEVYFLYHLKTRNSYKAVERYAHAAHDARRYCRKEGNERRYERRGYRHKRRHEYSSYGCVFRDSYATDALAVSRIRTASEQSAGQ